MQAYLKAIRSQKKDLRLALRQGSSELLAPYPANGRIIHHSTKNRKVIDSEDTKHLSEIQEDGRLITETRKTTEHEEVLELIYENLYRNFNKFGKTEVKKSARNA